MNWMFKKITQKRRTFSRVSSKGCLVAFLCLLSSLLQAQESNSANEVKAFFEKVQKAYLDASFVGFNIKYLYANGGSESRNIDSVSGEMQIDKGKVRFVIDGTETLVNDKYSIHVVDEDKLIYLSKPAGSNATNPLFLVDSTLAHFKGLVASVRPNGDALVLSMTLPEGRTPYSRITMTASRETGWIRKIEYELKTAPFVGQEMISTPGHPARYEEKGKVTILFDKYRTGAFNESVFSESKFFNRTKAGFTPVDTYKDYHIFLASSNL